MKKIFLPLLLILFMGCKMLKEPQVYLNMPEEQFTKAAYGSEQVELSANRTVYKRVLNPVNSAPSYKFYYFKRGKLAAMDEGYTPRGRQVPIPTPEYPY